MRHTFIYPHYISASDVPVHIHICFRMCHSGFQAGDLWLAMGLARCEKNARLTIRGEKQIDKVYVCNAVGGLLYYCIIVHIGWSAPLRLPRHLHMHMHLGGTGFWLGRIKYMWGD